MRPEILEQIRINKANTIRDKEQAARNAEAQKPQITMETIDGLEETFHNHGRSDLEHVPRDTVFKMLMNKQLDEPFIFSVEKGKGANYVQAMRQVLARTRKKARVKKVQLKDFKMYVPNIETKDDCDVVTVIRTRQIPQHLESFYDRLVDAFKREEN